MATDEGVRVRFHDVRPFGWDRTLEHLRAVLDRARIEYNTKLAAMELLRSADGVAEAAARVRGLELDRDVEAALLELVLADW